MTQTILLAGRLGSGKDTAAEYLTKKHDFKSLSFARKLKEITKALFQFSDESLYGPSEMRAMRDPRVDTPEFWDHAQAWVNGMECRRTMEELFKGTRVPVCSAIDALQEQVDEFQLNREELTVRHALQYLGTNWGRAMHENLWIHAVKNQIAKEPGNWVVTDCRYENEATNFLKNNPSVRLLWIDAQKRVPPTEASLHMSEPKLDDFWHLEPVVIDNNGKVEKMYSQIDAVILSPRA